MVMILRLAANPDLGIVEILTSIILLAAAVLPTIWLAAKIFRTGILMYGKSSNGSGRVKMLKN